MDRSQIGEVARSLLEAEHSCVPIAPLTTTCPAMTLADAYAIQVEIIAGKVRAGTRVVGRKVGLTSRAMQQMLGVNEPDYGVLLNDMVTASKGSIDCTRMIQPKVEPEIAFMLARDLKGPGVSAKDVLDASSIVGSPIGR
jgi:2-keto-4-pentenoate hydratase